jgi:hypothetical protein
VTIRNFIADPEAVRAWASQRAALFESVGLYASWWMHEDVGGFGFTLYFENSGEFHLMPDATVTKHVEVDRETIVDGSFAVESINDLAREFKDFARLVLGDVDVPKGI